MTTLSILLCAIFAKYQQFKITEELDEFSKEELSSKISNLRKKIIKEKIKQYEQEFGGVEVGGNKLTFLRVQPSTQDNNFADYKYLLSEIQLLRNIQKPNRYTTRQFCKAFRYF